MVAGAQQGQTIPKVITPQSPYGKGHRPFLRKIEAFMYRHRSLLNVVHVVMFIFFLALLIVPLCLPIPTEGSTLFNNLTVLSLFLIWGLWFPFVFISVIFTGRSWCGLLCPLGACSQWANQYGLKREIPRWLRWEGVPIVSFLIVTVLGQTLDVRDEPSGLAILFGIIFLAAILMGWLYGKGGKKRSWCRHACPIGLLLGVFSRLGMVQFTPKQVWSKISKKKDPRYAEQGICPTMIAINQKDESRHCIECFRCVKPSSAGGLFVELRAPGAEIETIKKHHPNLSEVLFIFMGTGIALGGFLWLILPIYQTLRQWLGTWFIEQGWYWIGNSGPSFLMSVHPAQGQSYNWLDFIMIVGFMFVFMLMSLAVLTLTNSLSSLLCKNAVSTFRERFTILGYQYAPVAMMSLLIGLGDLLFKTLEINFGGALTEGIKISLLLLSLGWSGWLGWRLLKDYATGWKRSIAMLPGVAGATLVVLAWWPAIFGSSFSLLTYYRHHLQLLH